VTHPVIAKVNLLVALGFTHAGDGMLVAIEDRSKNMKRAPLDIDSTIFAIATLLGRLCQLQEEASTVDARFSQLAEPLVEFRRRFEAFVMDDDRFAAALQRAVDSDGYDLIGATCARS
jgi:hypothetical protein